MTQSSDDLERKAMRALEDVFEQSSETRMTYAQAQYADDPELLTRVLSLLNTAGSMGDVLRTGGAQQILNDDFHPERAGAYKITSLIGHGGMGAVYKAERDTGDFDHEVAVKVIRPGVLSDALTARFENERQILASLNHPGIAKLLDGGVLADGSPYIVMEYVDGMPVTDWVNRQKLRIDDRLWLFGDICSAVAHAHQNLIVHRDITPSNVLVTEAGSIKLIDFGIAKPQSADDDEANVGRGSLASLSFTPGYAAPERGQGAPANTLSDIYSLGKLLAAMLEGVSMDADLRAIVDRASAHAPEDRYPSVTALSEDLRNYRTGYPVEARQGGGLYRIKKYLGRRKIFVGATVLAISALAVALSVTLIQFYRAEAALDRATARFDQARELSRTLVFETYDEFAQVSGTLEPRRGLADVLSNYIRQLAEDDQAPVDILFDVGQMNGRLAELYGGIGVANLGDTNTFETRLSEAQSAFEALLLRAPENSEAMAELAMVKRNLTMHHLIHRQDPETALTFNDQTLALAQRGVALGDEFEQTLLRHFWSARTDRLQILLDQEALDTALSEVQTWRAELDDEMFERLGGGEEMAAYLAVQQSEILIELGRPLEALSPLEYAETYRTTQLADAPENYYQKTQLMVVQMEKARAFSAGASITEALQASDAALSLAREILQDDPEDAGGPEGLNSVLQNHADFLKQAGSDAESLSAAREAIDLARGLDQEFPDDPYYQSILANSLITEAEVSDPSPQTCRLLNEASSLEELLNPSDGSTEPTPSDLRQKIEAQLRRHSCAPE